jgi:hypothetical protein
MDQGRREFIKASLLTAAAIPASNLFDEEAMMPDVSGEAFGKSLEFHVLDNNLLNLHFYFVNVERGGNNLCPKVGGQNAYMIVRLPQQHITEKAFTKTNQDNHAIQPVGELSGYSFLAFQLWPDKTWDEKTRRRFTIVFEINNLLDWNNQENFRLITLNEWLRIHRIDRLKFFDCSDLATAKRLTFDPIPQPPNGINLEPQSPIYLRYRKNVEKLFTSSAANPAPITLLEIPNKLYVTPLVRNPKGELDLNGLTRVRFSTPEPLADPHRTGARRFPVWHTRIWNEEKKSASKDSPATGDELGKFQVETPRFRVVGYAHGKHENDAVASVIAICNAAAVPCPDPRNHDNDLNMLPNLLTRAELTFLTQYATKSGDPHFPDQTQQEFDIKEKNGFFFTGLGVICHLKYENLEKRPAGFDLIEYEHIITQGRDVFVKVARLGVNHKTGQRYKYVQEAKRKIDDVNGSFMELKEYCKRVDSSKDYTLENSEANWNHGNYLTVRDMVGNGYVPGAPEAPCMEAVPHFRRYPLNRIEIVEKEVIPIKRLFEDATGNETVHDANIPDCGWFWPVREDAANVGDDAKNLTLNQYLLCQVDDLSSHDKENRSLKAKPFPFIFIYAHVFEAALGFLAAVYKSMHRTGGSFDDRRNIYLSDPKLAYTAPIPVSTPARGNDPLPPPPPDNKINIVETDYFEPYFNVRKLAQGQRIDDVLYPLYPQMLKARVFTQHVKDITQNAISSVLEYHDHFIKGGFTEEFDEQIHGAAQRIENYGKVFLKNTDAFKASAERAVNNTYDDIRRAFADAKDRLGNIAAPDIIPDTLSLNKLGLTLPDDISRQIENGQLAFDRTQKIFSSLSPRALLRGKLSEILGGIDLHQILDEFLPEDETPLFEIQKLLSQIENVISNSPVYKEIMQDLDRVTRELKGLQKTIDPVTGLLSQIADREREIKNLLTTLADAIPNVNEMTAYANAVFEKYRSQTIEFVLDDVHFNGVKTIIDSRTNDIVEFARQQKFLFYQEVQTKVTDLEKAKTAVDLSIGRTAAEIGQYLDLSTAVTEAANIVTNLRDFFSTNMRAFLAADPAAYWRPVVNGLCATNTDTQGVTIHFQGNDVQVYFDDKTFQFSQAPGPNVFTTFTNVGQTGYVQVTKKLEDVARFIAANQAGDAFQQETTAALRALSDTYARQRDVVIGAVKTFSTEIDSRITLITAWATKYKDLTSFQAAVIQNLTPEARQTFEDVHTLVTKLRPYLDLVQKLDPYFYYLEQQRLAKEIADISRRFKQGLYELRNEIQAKAVAAARTLAASEKAFADSVQAYVANNALYNDFMAAKVVYDNAKTLNINAINKLVENKIKDLAATSPEYKRIHNAYYQKVSEAQTEIKDLKTSYKNAYDRYAAYIKSGANQLANSVTNAIEGKIRQWENEISAGAGPEVIAKINEARNIYQLLLSIRQQDLKYNWSTNRFRDVNLGIIKFKKYSGPDTELKVAVKATTYFLPGRFPPAIDRVTTQVENRFTNFGIGFFNAITVNFNEVTFNDGSESGKHFGVKIKDVKFDGAFSFVQAFEKWLQTMGKGLILKLENDHVALGYSLPIPSVQTPAFSFFNLSLNFDFRLHFDRRPLQLGFSLATVDNKFGIAAGIFAGFGFFRVVAEPKRGIVELDMALEAGAWAGITIGPIAGEVKLAFGFRYTRSPGSVRLEGYILAEGRLTCWILDVSASIYLGIVSENSYVEGMCTVSYSVKMGFLSASFSGTFKKHIAGANSSNNQQQTDALTEYHARVTTSYPSIPGPVIAGAQPETLAKRIDRAEKNIRGPIGAYLKESDETNTPQLVTGPVTEEQWTKFINVF